MKRISFFLLILFALIPVSSGQAENVVKSIDSLVVELWPDYDRESVLVLLTGKLPAETLFPATVTLPLPETAQLNAVARIDSSDGIMKDDISSSFSPGLITFITPSPSFRLEYYLSYRADNNERAFDYTWLADLSVKNFQLKVQRPTSAISLKTEPAAENILKGEDGFDYHTFSPRTIPAGQAFSVRVDYTMIKAQLSVEKLSPPTTSVQSPETPSPSTAGSGINWPILVIFAGGFLIVIFFVWQVVSRRVKPDIQESLPSGAEKQSRPNFCPNCGKPVGKMDKFCGKCGKKF